MSEGVSTCVTPISQSVVRLLLPRATRLTLSMSSDEWPTPRANVVLLSAVETRASVLKVRDT